MQLIVVIDDDAELRKALERLLSAADYRVESYSSVEEFLRPGATTKVGCLLLDIELSGMSGLQLVSQLCAEGLAFHVLFMTGSDDKTVEAHIRKLGYRIVHKPSRQTNCSKRLKRSAQLTCVQRNLFSIEDSVRPQRVISSHSPGN